MGGNLPPSSGPHTNSPREATKKNCNPWNENEKKKRNGGGGTFWSRLVRGSKRNKKKVKSLPLAEVGKKKMGGLVGSFTALFMTPALPHARGPWSERSAIYPASFYIRERERELEEKKYQYIYFSLSDSARLWTVVLCVSGGGGGGGLPFGPRWPPGKNPVRKRTHNECAAFDSSEKRLRSVLVRFRFLDPLALIA